MAKKEVEYNEESIVVLKGLQAVRTKRQYNFEQDKLFIVYKHTRKSNKKSYIGITSRPLKDRCVFGKGYKKENCHFYNAILQEVNNYNGDFQKAWEEAWTHEILFSDLHFKEAIKKESELITLYNTTDENFGYNLLQYDYNTYQNSEMTRKKKSIAQKARIIYERKKKLKETSLPKQNSTKRGQHKERKTFWENNPEKRKEQGKKCKDFYNNFPEMRIVMGKFAKDRQSSLEYRKKLSEAHKETYRKNPELAKKHSQFMKDYFKNQKNREKLSNTLKTSITKNTRRKISNSTKQLRWYNNGEIEIYIKSLAAPEGFKPGRINRKHEIRHGTHWYNNGVVRKIFKDSDLIPEEFHRGYNL